MASTAVITGASILLAVSLASVIMRLFGFGSNQFPVNGKTVLITGGSEGMGRSAAIQLAKKGANVVIVSRSREKLAAAIADIEAAAVNPDKQRFHYISADLTNASDAERIIEETTQWNNGVPPDVVWCCAGFCQPGFFIDLPIQTHRDQMDTVYWTAAYTAHATLKRWLAPVSPGSSSTASTPRHMIFTASILSFWPLAGYGPYAPAKAAMRGLADVLVQEIEMYNGARRNKQNPAPAADVRIHIVFPMGILSPGYENEQKLKPELTKILEGADEPQTPDKVAEVAIKGLERGDYQIVTAPLAHLVRGSALGPSPRNNFLFDTVAAWLANLVALFAIPDLSGKAFKYGKKGISGTGK